MYKKLFTLFFVFFLVFFTQNRVLAAEFYLPDTTINPDKYLFFSIKRLIEKAVVFTKFSKNSKMDYYKDLTLRRMAELKYVVEKKLIGEVETSTQRLSYQVGVLSDYLSSNKKDLAEKRQTVRDLFLNYNRILENLRDEYPANSSYWMLVQHSINSIDINLEKLK